MSILKNSSLLISLLFVLSCNDNVSLKENDLEKYTWLSPFTKEITYTNFKGSHNIDLGILDFSCTNSDKRTDDVLLLQLDSIANTNQWDILLKNEFERTYSKFIPKEDRVIMRIKLDIKRDRLIFNIR